MIGPEDSHPKYRLTFKHTVSMDGLSILPNLGPWLQGTWCCPTPSLASTLPTRTRTFPSSPPSTGARTLLSPSHQAHPSTSSGQEGASQCNCKNIAREKINFANIGSNLKWAVSRDFFFFFYELTPSGPLMNRLKWFCLKIRFREDVREIRDSVQCQPAVLAFRESIFSNVFRTLNSKTQK